MLHSLLSRWLVPGLIFPFLLLGTMAQAQCPTATSACTPGGAPSANLVFGMGIFNVTLGTINNTTAGAADGFKDYSCTTGTSLTVGTNYTISVRTNANADENVRVWLDMNNDGQLNPTTELVFSNSGRATQTGTIQIPATAVLGVRLRLRVAADYTNVAVPTPCSTPQYSQTEDYSVTLLANTAPPVAAFTANQTTTCTGCVQFTDQSTNAPTSWLWNFGNGVTSTQQNPNYCYPTPGTYTVTLTATNAAGNNVATKTNYITYNNQVPVATTCLVPTVAYCCSYGITSFTLGTLVNTSSNAQVGYEDFTCTKRVSLTEGTSQTLVVQPGNTNGYDLRGWLDLNNDGQFTSNELIIEALNQTNTLTRSVAIPAGVKNTPLRLRVICDYAGAPMSPCSSVQYGQAEDYSVTLLPNMQPPAAAFTSNYSTTCSSTVQFTDQSTNAPTGWLWNFGDGNTSTLQNPTHTYTTSGAYDVTLTASNANGQNATIKYGYIAVTVPCVTYCTSSGQNTNLWISNVTVRGTAPPMSFTNSSAADAGGYGNYTGKVISLYTGSTYALSVTAGNAFNRTTSVWIDYNRNGIFDTSELLANGTSTIVYTTNFTVPTTTGTVGFTRMRIVTRLNNNAANACVVNQANSETEDYSVNILDALASREARSLRDLAVYPNPTADGQLHLRLADNLPSSTYTLTVQNLLGATVRTGSLRLVGGQPAALDLSALPKGVYMLQLNGADGQHLVRRVVLN